MASQRRLVHHQDSDPWGWVIVGATFVILFITIGNLKALGVLLLAMQTDFDSDVWIIGWMAVLYNIMGFFTAPLVASINRLVGSRHCVVIIGGVLGSAGFILGSQSSTLLQLTLSITILSGFGKAMSIFPTVGAMASFFKENYSLAIAISSTSVPMSMILYGPLAQILLDTYGWRGTMLIMGGITSNIVVCGALIRTPVSSATGAGLYQQVPNDTAEVDDTTPSKSHQGKCSTLKGNIQRIFTSMDFKILKNKRFLLLTAGKSCVDFCFSGWVVYMVSHGIFLGLSSYQASLLPTTFGIGIILGKSMPPVFDRTKFKQPSSSWAYLGSFIMFASFLADAFVIQFAVQMLVTGFIGLGFGNVTQGYSVLVRFLTSVDRMVDVLCWQAFIGGFGGMGSGLLTGLIYEWTGSFQAALVMYSGVMLISIPLFILYDKTTKREQDGD